MNVVTYTTRFGDAWIAFDDTDVVELGLPGTAAPDVAEAPPPAAIRRLVRRLEAYWAGRGPLPPADSVIRAAAATAFQKRVYEVVASIPAGETMTYAEVAAAVGRPNAARAVGMANATNPFAPLVPCHRVVGSDGTLRGYGGGLAMKRALLEMEAGGILEARPLLL